MLRLKEQKDKDKQIKKIFKEKKVEMKAHYEKIKAAIKKSIDEDLKELEIQEEEEMESWKRNV